jgi:hypothetical protein
MKERRIGNAPEHLELLYPGKAFCSKLITIIMPSMCLFGVQAVVSGS